MAFFVEITDVDLKDLEFLGYYLVEQDHQFALYTNKGDAYIVHINGKRRHIYVEDPNDAEILRRKNKIPTTWAE
jgi:hypothetical protein